MITDLRLQHFRSYNNDSFEFGQGVNIIVGPNASGKTNLLEALLVVARGSSYRASDLELVAFGRDWARLEAHTKDNKNRVVVMRADARPSKQFKLDGQTFKRLSLPRTLPVIVFEPNNIQIVSGAPELRRQFLDDLLEQTISGFGTIRRQYRRTLAQRNSLLKKGPGIAKSQLFAWDVRLSELGAQIAIARQELTETLNHDFNKLYDELAQNKAAAKLHYQTTAAATANYATDLLHKLETYQTQDFERGFTAYGPHREDLQIFLDKHQVQETASRGESRTILLVLKILEATLVEKARDLRPLLLLDDVFSELDGARRHALTDFLQPYQTFITTTDADVVLQHFTESAQIIPMEKRRFR